MEEKINKFWISFCKKSRVDENIKYDYFSFGNRKEWADALSKLVKDGIKLATSLAFSLYEGEELKKSRSILSCTRWV